MPLGVNPLQVTVDGGVKFLVMDVNDDLPRAFALLGTKAEKPVAIRLAGGCKGMSDDDKIAMLEFFSEAFRGYKGVLWSGGTRQAAKNGKIDPIVTDVPGVIASENPGCIALGTAPRTEIMTLQDESRLVFDQYGTSPNPSMHAILVVQDGPENALDWDGDVDAYFQLMEDWRDINGFTALGLIAWNGGPITAAEIERAAEKEWPVILIEGSGRAADEAARAITEGRASYPTDTVTVVSKNDPMALRAILTKEGFLG